MTIAKLARDILGFVVLTRTHLGISGNLFRSFWTRERSRAAHIAPRIAAISMTAR